MPKHAKQPGTSAQLYTPTHTTKTDDMPRRIRFTKMHGLGNDYIYVDTTQQPINNPAALAVKWSDRHIGIGSDGLVLIGKSPIADFSMRIFNADGSEAMMCGNASRCIGKYVYENRLTRKTDIQLDTLSGIKRLTLHLSASGDSVESVTVDMGTPSLYNKQQVATDDGSLREGEFHINGSLFKGTYVCMGNPHLVIFVNDAESVPLSQIGSLLENHPLFPQKTNVEFAQMKSADTVRMRVWERGSGITQACGTGACATAVAAMLVKQAPHNIKILMDGGMLQITLDKSDGHIYMRGEAETVFDGTIETDD